MPRWVYAQLSGELLRDGERVGKGYSGGKIGVNNPVLQHIRNVGPIPRGRWTMSRPFTHPTKGEVCIRLDPCEGTDTFGRSGFLVHGDSRIAPGTASASEGCIVLPRGLRVRLGESDDRELLVVEHVLVAPPLMVCHKQAPEEIA